VVTTVDQTDTDIHPVSAGVTSTDSTVVLVEFGGIGGCPIDEIDAAVTTLPAEGPTFETLQTRVMTTTSPGDGMFADQISITAGALAGQRAVAMCDASDVDIAGTVLEISGTEIGPERELIEIPDVYMDTDQITEQLIPDRTSRDLDLEVSLSHAERAVDDRLGIITQVGERESFPAPYYIAQVASTESISDARATEFAAGVDADWNSAYMKALGEALERYCAGVYRTEMFTTAPEET
jgi:ribosomal protein S12 methylthiotransferase accessory factor